MNQLLLILLIPNLELHICQGGNCSNTTSTAIFREEEEEEEEEKKEGMVAPVRIIIRG
jgi:hypothetical protein